jgi:hypothetical protein
MMVPGIIAGVLRTKIVVKITLAGPVVGIGSVLKK